MYFNTQHTVELSTRVTKTYNIAYISIEQVMKAQRGCRDIAVLFI